jgi:hypothetical protein
MKEELLFWNTWLMGGAPTCLRALRFLKDIYCLNPAAWLNDIFSLLDFLFDLLVCLEPAKPPIEADFLLS